MREMLAFCVDSSLNLQITLKKSFKSHVPQSGIAVVGLSFVDRRTNRSALSHLLTHPIPQQKREEQEHG